VIALGSIDAGVFATIASFAFEGRPHFTHSDDMMIGMRYARNLALHGGRAVERSVLGTLG